MAAYVKTRSHVGVRVAVLAVLIGLALMVQSLYPGAASIVPQIVLGIICVSVLCFDSKATWRVKALLRAVRRKGLRNEWRDSDTGPERSPLLPETAAAASQHGSERPASVNSHRSVTQPTISKTRIHFLDNMKVWLTFLVVLHHSLLAIGPGCGSWPYVIGYHANDFWKYSSALLSINQSYFMFLFFFCSGYVSPTSLDRAGPALFMARKLKRLGIPFLVYFFGINPLVYFVIFGWPNGFVKPRELPEGVGDNTTAGGANFSRDLKGSAEYMVGPGPPWFLMWLLMFQAAYCFIRGGGGGSGTNQANPPALAATDSAGFHASQRRPAFWKLAAGGVLLGGVQALCNVPTGITSLLWMPMSYGALPFDIAAFAAGIVSRRRDWLRATLPASGTAFAFVGTVVGLGANYCNFLPSVVEATSPPNLPEGAWTTIMYLINGFAGVSVAYCTVAVFQRWFDFVGPVSKRLARAAYTVYIIHILTVTIATYAYAELLRGAFTSTTTMWTLQPNGTATPTIYPPAPLDVFPGFYYGATIDCPGVSTTPLVSSKFDIVPDVLWYTTEVGPGLLELGAFFIGVLAQVPLWGVAYGLSQLPLLRDVL